jgi:hypothetical protein
MSRKENEIYCNRCGKLICREDRRDYTSFLTVTKEWGYFSCKKDGIRQSFDLCEPCYDSLTEDFAIPPKTQRMTELI